MPTLTAVRMVPLRQQLHSSLCMLRLSSSLRQPVLLRPARRLYSSNESSSLPRIASPSLWASMVPKPLRGSGKNISGRIKNLFTGHWNPATFFIVMSLLIGSNAIQMVSLKTRRLNYKRSTEAKLTLLREVIGRVQKGEDVDVEAMLGTGDPEQEKEWEEAMKDLQRDIDVWEEKDKAARTTVVEKVAAPPPRKESARPRKDDAERKPGFY